MTNLDILPPDFDNGVDDEIQAYLNPQQPRSFFLYAGAGSGKTRSLKEALDRFRKDHGDQFSRFGKKIAVITYTNAAADEIAARVGQDSLFPISTIHSFCWSHIKTFHGDIQAWLLNTLPLKIDELRQAQAKGRAGTKAAFDRERTIAKTQKRMEWLSVPRRFTYNPNGDNFGADSLSHDEVLKVTAEFIQIKPAMQAALVNRYPFLLIDESQDTSKILLEAFFKLAEDNTGRFALGLFGDTMQRIYFDGYPDLEQQIPQEWARPRKRMNHRSPRRVVQLGNAVRASADHQQAMRNDSEQGVVRLFVASSKVADKPALEKRLRSEMAEICDDPQWQDVAAVKTLTLEHHMAASRRGFLKMFQALDKDSSLGTGLRKGDLAGLRLFTEHIAPLVAAVEANDAFAVMGHLRKVSPRLKPAAISMSATPDDPLKSIRTGIDALMALGLDKPDTTFLEVLQTVAEHQLFEIPRVLLPFAEREVAGIVVEDEEDVPSAASSENLDVWRAFLETPYRQTKPYAEYVSDQGPYGTHQGVKGREFDRVFVILDDGEARGFLFSYEKLFGAKPLSETDRNNLAEGNDNSILRTRRLLYVTCTRAQKSLALIAYTDNLDALVVSAEQKGWFKKDEIVRVNDAPLRVES